MANDRLRIYNIGSQASERREVRKNRWHRKHDVVGTSLTAGGLSAVHREYLAAGGLDFLIGDGRLNYAPEYVWESFYSARLRPACTWRSV
jgi:high affinity Mn2+ porin